MEVPSTSENKDLQDRFNRAVAEQAERTDKAIQYIKEIPNDGSITTVDDIINYLRGI